MIGLGRSRCRRIIAIGLACVIASAVSVSVASAADQVFFEGLLSNQSATSGFSAPVSQTSARSLDGQSVCVAALYPPGGPLAGDVVCDNDLAVHPYCHCDYKYGFVRSLIGGNVNTRARMNWPS